VTEISGFDLQSNDPYGLGVISHDSLHIDMPPAESLAPDGMNFWQNSTHEPLDVDAVDLDGSSSGRSDRSVAETGSPLIDFDTSELDGGPTGNLADPATLEQGPPALRRSTMSAARSVAVLQANVEDDPENWTLRRELAEAMLESGDRDGGIRELEAAMLGAERANELDLASSIAEAIARLAPDMVRFHQKRVEYAFRTNDKLRLIEAYLALAGALLNTQQAEKARAVYQRVLDLAPDDIRAQAALESLAAVEPPAPEPAPPKKGAARATAPGPSPIRTRSAEPAPRPGERGFVNLGDLLRDDAPRSTRMIVDEEEPSGDEEADFADMLKKFKQGIAENVAQEDYQSHYDLGVAFKEMGLVDEAVAEFQKALRAPSNRLPTYEALGQCFIEKEQFAIASTVLARALGEKGYTDDDLVGVLYLLGRAAEAQNRYDEALNFYQRVFVVDIQFRDIAERISEVERIAR
jgi:tetratricopeptide (TPR) repeat protein